VQNGGLWAKGKRGQRSGDKKCFSEARREKTPMNPPTKWTERRSRAAQVREKKDTMGNSATYLGGAGKKKRNKS